MHSHGRNQMDYLETCCYSSSWFNCTCADPCVYTAIDDPKKFNVIPLPCDYLWEICRIYNGEHRHNSVEFLEISTHRCEYVASLSSFILLEKPQESRNHDFLHNISWFVRQRIDWNHLPNRICPIQSLSICCAFWQLTLQCSRKQHRRNRMLSSKQFLVYHGILASRKEFPCDDHGSSRSPSSTLNIRHLHLRHEARYSD